MAEPGVVSPTLIVVSEIPVVGSSGHPAASISTGERTAALAVASGSSSVLEQAAAARTTTAATHIRAQRGRTAALVMLDFAGRPSIGEKGIEITAVTLLQRP